jgi:hypothetical protein
MEFNQDKTILGFSNYLYYEQNARVEELNERIFDRFHPDPIGNEPNSLEVNFNPRSVPTKYTKFPIISKTKTINPSQQYNQNLPKYQIETQFNPGYRGPVSGFQSNVDKETILRNIPFALQPDIAQSTFIPSSNSDLYKTYIVSRPSNQPHPKLFENYKFDQQPNTPISRHPEIGNNLFFNATRNQLREVVIVNKK